MKSHESLTPVKRTNGVEEGKKNNLDRAKAEYESLFDREKFIVT